VNTAGAPTGNPSPAPSTSPARTTRQINGAKFLVTEAKVGQMSCSPSLSKKIRPELWQAISLGNVHFSKDK